MVGLVDILLQPDKGPEPLVVQGAKRGDVVGINIGSEREKPVGAGFFFEEVHEVTSKPLTTKGGSKEETEGADVPGCGAWGKRKPADGLLLPEHRIEGGTGKVLEESGLGIGGDSIHVGCYGGILISGHPE